METRIVPTTLAIDTDGVPRTARTGVRSSTYLLSRDNASSNVTFMACEIASAYPHRRKSSVCNSKHFLQGHLKLLSAGIAEWLHLLQTNLPSSRAIICLNSSSETQ